MSWIQLSDGYRNMDHVPQVNFRMARAYGGGEAEEVLFGSVSVWSSQDPKDIKILKEWLDMASFQGGPETKPRPWTDEDWKDGRPCPRCRGTMKHHADYCDTSQEAPR